MRENHPQPAAIRPGEAPGLLRHLDQLGAALLDFALAFQHGDIDDRLASQRLFESPLALVVVPSSPLATRPSLTLPELAGLRLALPVQGYSTRQVLDAAFEAHKIRPVVSIAVNDRPTLFQLGETGHWSTILTMATVDKQHSVTTIPIMGERMGRRARVVWLRDTYRKKAAVHFCDMLM